jgi:uncharacterized membrane protein YjgN (DUF898 family)
MTTVEAAVSAAEAASAARSAPSETPAPAIPAGTRATAPGQVRFLGDPRVFRRLMTRGAVLLLITLGIYRFWLTTDMRRFLWANTAVADTSFEYYGTARELLLGFLVAVTVLVPLNVVLFIIVLNFDVIGIVSSPLLFLAFTVLGHFAVYRARRYRLTRTVFRGVRFHQTGSAWRYAVCALFWWTMIVLSVGLAWPWAQSRLERFKMRHTHFGDVAGRFEGSALHLFVRGGLMWLVVMAPFIFGVVAAVRAADWAALPGILAGGEAELFNRLVAAGFITTLTIGIAAVAWLILAGLMLYPAFQSLMWRWWASGLRFGDMTVTSRLRTGRVYGIYARFVLYSLLFSLLAAAIGGVGAVMFWRLTGPGASAAEEVAGTVVLIGAYVIVALGFSTIYQIVVKLGFWKAVVESLDFSNLSALDRVTASGTPSSAVGEGLADALNVGEI